MAELQQREIERRLSLYQVFVKLYEQHRHVLDDILQLENLTQPSFAVNQGYIQGVVDGSTVYIITNLCDRKTQSLQQPQGIWTIGRDDSNGIYIADQYLSERHAAIQYIDNQGFYLIDFKSVNGSYVNGEPVYQPTKLDDGDRIRLGMVTFDFFINHTSRTLPTVAMELLMQLASKRDDNAVNLLNPLDEEYKYQEQKVNHSLHIIRGSDLNESPPLRVGSIDLRYQHSNFTLEEKSDILDRFFSRHQPDNFSL